MAPNKLKAEAQQHRRKTLSVAWVADLRATHGHDVAVRTLEEMLPHDNPQQYCVIKRGRPSVRIDTADERGMAYENFNPPALWGEPYSVLKVRFEPGNEKSDYMSHVGEEILIPIDGGIVYHFHWSEGGSPPREEILKPPLKRNALIRINPQIPHHTWAAGQRAAVAWMIFRADSGSAASISVDSQPVDGTGLPTPRRWTATQLEDSATYALVAWGLAEKIRHGRERANLRITHLAKQCDITPSQLSRIENADTNPSMEAILRIAHTLQIDLLDVLNSVSWDKRTDRFTHAKCETASVRQCLKGPSSCRESIRILEWGLPAATTSIDAEWASLVAIHKADVCRRMMSWIVLTGTAIFELETAEGIVRTMVEAGSVMHCRNISVRKITPLEDSHIVQVQFDNP
jgi:transcriptional regulator with XRE-family HTH domain